MQQTKSGLSTSTPPIKVISYHRALSFLITKRTIQSYEKLTGETYTLADSIDGTTGWCDFYSQSEWYECSNAFQNASEAEYMFKNLFKLNLEAIETEYFIKIDRATIPPLELNKIRGYQVDTKKIVKESLCKKLKKPYPHQNYGFSKKGTLILGIFDPVFGGFKQDLEFNSNVLNALKNELSQLYATSTFSRVVLIDVLTSFEADSENRVYELFNSASNSNP